MAPIKSYELVTTNSKRIKAEVRDSDGTALYEVDFSFVTADLRSAKPGRHSIVFQTPSSSTTNTQQVLGFCDFTFSSLSAPIHLGFGDSVASPDTVLYEDILVRQVVKQSGFELSIDLGGNIGRKTFDWKRTHDIENMSALSRKLDFLHMKMVERDSGAVVAKFAHNCDLFGHKRGDFTFEEYNGGSDWDRVVLLSGLAVLEYLRKSQGWSW